MGFFGCFFAGILLAFFLLLGIGLVILQKILALFGIHLPIEKLVRININHSFDSNQQDSQSQRPNPSSTTTSAPQPSKKQLYDDNVGEYVEFEEIKD